MKPQRQFSTMSLRTASHKRLPFFFEGSSFTTSADTDITDIADQTKPLLHSPTFVDIADILDSTMSEQASTQLRTSHARWNATKAVVLTGKAMVQHLIQFNYAVDEDHATSIGQAIVRANGLIPTFKVQTAKNSFVPVSSCTYVHRGLTCVFQHGLNAMLVYPYQSRPMKDVLLDLNTAFRQICHVSVSLDGHFVNYSAIRGTIGWRRALVLLAELAHCDDTDFGDVDEQVKKACFFNLYNLLIFHAKLVFGHPSDILRRSNFFNNAAYVIAGKRLSSVELEHAVLRRRMPPNDDRIAWRLKQLDPRMHFVLNCGAHSCPAIHVIDADGVEQALKDATVEFIEANVEVDLIQNRVTLSRLWKWFRFDFTPGSNEDDALLNWIAHHADEITQAQLSQLLKADYKIKFASYNWADNGDSDAKPDDHFMAIYDRSFARTA